MFLLVSAVGIHPYYNLRYVYAAYPFLAARVFPKARAQLREGVVATAVDNLVHVPTVYLPGYFMSTYTGTRLKFCTILKLASETYLLSDAVARIESNICFIVIA